MPPLLLKLFVAGTCAKKWFHLSHVPESAPNKHGPKWRAGWREFMACRSGGALRPSSVGLSGGSGLARAAPGLRVRATGAGQLPSQLDRQRAPSKSPSQGGPAPGGPCPPVARSGVHIRCATPRRRRETAVTCSPGRARPPLPLMISALGRHGLARRRAASDLLATQPAKKATGRHRRRARRQACTSTTWRTCWSCRNGWWTAARCHTVKARQVLGPVRPRQRGLRKVAATPVARMCCAAQARSCTPSRLTANSSPGSPRGSGSTPDFMGEFSPKSRARRP